jgi:hypothetical protein
VPGYSTPLSFDLQHTMPSQVGDQFVLRVTASATAVIKSLEGLEDGPLQVYSKFSFFADENDNLGNIQCITY